MVALRASTLALALALAAPSSSVLAAPIANTADLYSTIASEGGLVGFLSDANYASVSHVLPPRAEGDAKVPGKTTVAIFEDQADLLEAVRSGTLLAGSLSGPPEDSEGLVVFSSEAISPRAMMLMPSRVCDDAANGTNATYTSSVHMAAAVNAAIANVVASGGFAELLDASSPFYVASAATCAAAPDLFPYPVAANVPATDVISDVFQSGVLKVCALCARAILAGSGERQRRPIIACVGARVALPRQTLPLPVGARGWPRTDACCSPRCTARRARPLRLGPRRQLHRIAPDRFLARLRWASPRRTARWAWSPTP